MRSIQSVPRGEQAVQQDDLFMSLELGDKRWKLSIGDGRHGVSRYDVPTLIAVPAVLGLVTVIASWLPARRAMRLDPVRAIRAE